MVLQLEEVEDDRMNIDDRSDLSQATSCLVSFVGHDRDAVPGTPKMACYSVPLHRRTVLACRHPKSVA